MGVSDSELTDLIYAAMLGERPWEVFLDRLSATSPGAMSLMFALRADQAFSPVSLLRGRGDDVRADWDAHFAGINPYVPGCMRKPLGRGVEGDRLVPRERLIGTEFYNDFMRGNELAATVGIAVGRSPGATILISTATRLHDEAEQRRLADQYPGSRRTSGAQPIFISAIRISPRSPNSADRCSRRSTSGSSSCRSRDGCARSRPPRKGCSRGIFGSTAWGASGS